MGARVLGVLILDEAHAKWATAGYSMPAPASVKRAVLMRYGRSGDTWVETGTFLGDTTAVLAKSARQVISIEPGSELARRARERFASTPNVKIIEGLSEECLPELLQAINGPVSFWLDGHYSAGATYQGPIDTPIRQELAAIETHLDRWDVVTILVDDMRCFDPTEEEYSTYPKRVELAGRAERNALTWTIEHDIFVAFKR